MADWAQVVLLVACLVIGAACCLMVRRQCQRCGCGKQQTTATVVTTASFLLFLLLYFVPDHFPVLCLPVALGISLLVLDLLVFITAVVATLCLEQRKELDSFVDTVVPPDA